MGDVEVEAAVLKERIGKLEVEAIDYRSQLKMAEREIKTLVSERDEFKGVLISIADGDECSYDHHDYCQTHLLHEKPCPWEVANELNDRLGD